MAQEKVQLHLEFVRHTDRTSLSPSDILVLDAAIAARNKAYAPYSDFLVGASLLLANGELLTGNNQENGAYPSGLCAERVCAFYAGAQFPGVEWTVLAIAAWHRNGRTDAPPVSCGSCRQSLMEYEQRQAKPVRILMTGNGGSILEAPSVESLLPFPFELKR